MRILFVVSGLGFGGAELMMLKLFAHIDRNRFHPAVISISKPADIAEQVRRLGIEVHVIDLLSEGFFRGVFHLFELVRRIRPDILQGWMIHGNLVALLVGVCLRVPVFWGVRHLRLLRETDKGINLFIEWVLGRVSRLPARIIYNSKAGKRHHEAMGYYPGRALVIPNGFDAARFAPSSSIRQAVRRSLAIPDDAVVIGMVARYNPAKDHRNFLEAAALLREHNRGAVFVLVGRGCERTNVELVSIINSLQLDDFVKLTGERSDVYALINAFDIGTLSSASEGFANAVGECMCCALPCVVTDAGDSGWIVGDSGITVPPRDPVSLCRGWTELIEAGPSAREARGRRARERIVSLFSIDAVAKKYEAAYLQCVSRNIDDGVVADFGEEWSRFDQSGLSPGELREMFEGYFSVFPWDALPPGATGFDLGCGSGRWAKLVAPRVGELHCIDPSDKALAVAKSTLRGLGNCRFHLAGVDNIPLPDESADFGYSLGVLHHVPDTPAALQACSKKLKRGAPFLVYLYFAFDNKPPWYRQLWRLSDFVRRFLIKFPYPVRFFVSQCLAFLVYWPLARSALLLERLGCDVGSFPLAYYRRRSLYAMRNDALDRFSTRLEKRFTKIEIDALLRASGFTRITFSDSEPYWCAVAYKA